MLPGCAHAGACAAFTFPQHGQVSSGSRYSVTNLAMFTSQTCDHQVPARAAPASPVPHREHLRRRRQFVALVRVRVAGKP
jgi:hypothetical protein